MIKKNLVSAVFCLGLLVIVACGKDGGGGNSGSNPGGPNSGASGIRSLDHAP